jgi:Bacterial virulence factor lipase N-terminal
MWLPSVLGSLDFRSFHSRTRRGRRSPTRKLCLETLEDRTLLTAVHPLFDLAALTTSPFPSDRWTVADGTQNTGRRVNLPLPDLIMHRSDNEDPQVLNTLDGFNMQPRLSIPFDGPIDVNTVNSQDVFLVSMGDTLDSHDHGGQVVGINQVVWDPATNTLHVESNDLLDQHTRYALIVTNGVHDARGHPVEATLGFRLAPLTLTLSHDPVLRTYGLEMVEGLVAAHRAGVREQDIVTASVFRTESATAILEKIRDQIHAATPDPADFTLGPDGTRTVFSLDQVNNIALIQQTGDDPPVFTPPVNLNLSLLQVIPGAVGQIAFGKYLSSDYEVHPGEFIPPVGTRTGNPSVQGMNEIFFNLVLPSSPKPASGWPVALFGHGSGVNKNEVLNVAASLAAHGLATISINVVGHGRGPLSTLTVTQAGGGTVTLPAGGRGIDQNDDHEIGSSEGLEAMVPRRLIHDRDWLRQTVADLMQLVRVIQVGMDVDGDGNRDLDPSRIYYFGNSLGGMYGTQFIVVEPAIGSAVLTVPVGDQAIRAVFSPVFRGDRGGWLAERIPSLINSPGVTEIGGVTVAGPFFNDNLPLRTGDSYRVLLEDGTSHDIPSPVINDAPGAMAIQQLFGNAEWAMLSGDALAYIPHVCKDPLVGMPQKSVIFQFDNGDQNVPNPISSAMLRAGDLADRATFYRHDLAFAEDPTLPNNGHGFMSGPSIFNPGLRREIALGAQEQIATFFASDGITIIHPEPARYFDVPIQGPLPEDLNYIPPSAPAPAPAPYSRSPASGPIPTEAAGGSPPISGLFAALQLGRTPADPGAVIAASWTSQLDTNLVDEGTAFGAGATFLSLQPLPQNSLAPDSWRLREPTRADQVFHRLSRAPATNQVVDQVFADRDDSWLQDMFGDY